MPSIVSSVGLMNSGCLQMFHVQVGSTVSAFNCFRCLFDNIWVPSIVLRVCLILCGCLQLIVFVFMLYGTDRSLLTRHNIPFLQHNMNYHINTDMIKHGMAFDKPVGGTGGTSR